MAENLIKAWANDKKRRDWIDNYRDWGMSYELANYDLEFFEVVLPDDRILIAMECNQRRYDYSTRQNFIGRGVIYYIRDSNDFIPDRMSESAIANELKNLKVKLQKEEN